MVMSIRTLPIEVNFRSSGGESMATLSSDSGVNDKIQDVVPFIPRKGDVIELDGGDFLVNRVVINYIKKHPTTVVDVWVFRC